MVELGEQAVAVVRANAKGTVYLDIPEFAAMKKKLLPARWPEDMIDALFEPLGDLCKGSVAEQKAVMSFYNTIAMGGKERAMNVCASSASIARLKAMAMANTEVAELTQSCLANWAEMFGNTNEMSHIMELQGELAMNAGVPVAEPSAKAKEYRQEADLAGLELDIKGGHQKMRRGSVEYGNKGRRGSVEAQTVSRGRKGSTGSVEEDPYRYERDTHNTATLKQTATGGSEAAR